MFVFRVYFIVVVAVLCKPKRYYESLFNYNQVYSKSFEFALAAVILTNAISLGILTLPGLSENATNLSLIHI